MNGLAQSRFSAHYLLAAVIASQLAACTGNILPPDPQPTATATPSTGVAVDRACPSGIPDQSPTVCPRLKNIALTCGGNGMLHTSVGGGSGSPITVGAKLDDGSNFSAVLVVVNCQDGPREGVTFGVTYTGEISTPPNAPPCIRQSKADFSQFQFGDPLYGVFEGLAKGKIFETLDASAVGAFADSLGLARPAMPRCSIWRQMP